MEKTAVTVLQELMVKLGDTPDYECIAQSGPQHLAMFQYRCQARGVTVVACARSKKEAKQEAARAMLLQLAARGHSVCAPYGRDPAASSSSTLHTAPSGVGDGAAGADGAGGGGGGGGGMPPVSAPVGAHSYVALLKDLCEEYRLPAVEYELVGDTGPPHCRRFTVRARVCRHERLATSTTKKAARQMAAEQLYTYLRENLARVTKDFDEKEALARVHEKAMQRYTEVRDETVWRPDLGQRVSEYHRGLLTHIDEDKRAAARQLLEAPAPARDVDVDEEERLAGVARALGLEAELKPLPAEGGDLWLAALERASPPIVVAARTREDAVTRALKYLRLALSLDD